MKRWEYLRAFETADTAFYAQQFPKDIFFSSNTWRESVDKLGDEGWELCNRDVTDDYIVWFFKREKQPLIPKAPELEI